MKETITEQILSKQLDYLLEIKDLKETNEQLDSALVKAYDDIKSLGAQYDEVYNSVGMHVDKEIDKDELIEVLKNTLGL